MTNMQRRGFLGAMLAAAVAPAAVRAGVLMPVKKVWVPSQEIAAPTGPIIWGDGIHDDTAALQAFVDGRPVMHPDGRAAGGSLFGGTYRLTQTIFVADRLAFRRIDSSRIVIDHAGSGIRIDSIADNKSITNCLFDRAAQADYPGFAVGWMDMDSPPFNRKYV